MRAGNRLGLSSHSFPAERLLKSLRKSRFQRLLKAAYKHKWCIQTHHGRKKETQSPTTYALQLVAWHSPHLTGPIDEILQDVLVAKSHGGRLISKKRGTWLGKQTQVKVGNILHSYFLADDLSFAPYHFPVQSRDP